MDADSGTLHPAPGHGRAKGLVDILAVALIGIGSSWSAGNIGPVVAKVSHDLDISLTSVGLLSGTIFYAACVVGLLLAPRLAEALGLIKSLAIGAAIGALGSVVFAIADGFAVAAAGRFLAGLGLGFAAGLGPVLARITGGVGRVGLFGASFQLGIALGLGVGSVLVDVGVEWRVIVAVTAGVAFTAVPFLLEDEVQMERHEPAKGFYPLAVRSGDAWRLALLFMAMFSVPLTLGAWFIHYTSTTGGLSLSAAGSFAFLLFALSAAGREIGGALARGAVRPALLTGFTPLLAAAGLAAMAIDTSAPTVAIAVVLMAAGFALPYATMMIGAQRLFPLEPARPTSALTMLATFLAIPMVPLIGTLLDSGDGDVAFGLLAAAVMLAAALNVRQVERPLGEDGARET